MTKPRVRGGVAGAVWIGQRQQGNGVDATGMEDGHYEGTQSSITDRDELLNHDQQSYPAYWEEYQRENQFAFFVCLFLK